MICLASEALMKMMYEGVIVMGYYALMMQQVPPAMGCEEHVMLGLVDL